MFNNFITSHLVILGSPVFYNLQCPHTWMIITTCLLNLHTSKFDTREIFFLDQKISLQLPHLHLHLHTISYHSFTIMGHNSLASYDDQNDKDEDNNDDPVPSHHTTT